MPPTATQNQGKSQFVREVLDADPRANARAVNEAWRAAGMPGSISAGLVNHLRFRLGLSGNLRGKRKLSSERRRYQVSVRPEPGRNTPTLTRVRSNELMGLEVEIDRLLMQVAEIGRLPEVEDELRRVSRQLYARMVARS